MWYLMTAHCFQCRLVPLRMDWLSASFQSLRRTVKRSHSDAPPCVLRQRNNQTNLRGDLGVSQFGRNFIGSLAGLCELVSHSPSLLKVGIASASLGLTPSVEAGHRSRSPTIVRCNRSSRSDARQGRLHRAHDLSDRGSGDRTASRSSVDTIILFSATKRFLHRNAAPAQSSGVQAVLRLGLRRGENQGRH
jgi:hypothetical protein